MDVEIINAMNEQGDRVQMVVPEEVAILYLQFDGDIEYQEIGDTLVWLKDPTRGGFTLQKSMILACLVEDKEEDLWDRLINTDTGIDTVTRAVDAQCHQDQIDRREQAVPRTTGITSVIDGMYGRDKR